MNRAPDISNGFVEHAAGRPASASGPLSGVRLAAKDNIAVTGLLWTAGLPLRRDVRATGDAPCVAALRSAGAEIVGVTATDSGGFGMTTPGVRNPRDPGRTVGGSSGGSGAVVAAGLADLALGSDTAGSVRAPAACCGVLGFKPTHGAVPVAGVVPMAPRFDHVGLLAAELSGLVEGMRVLLNASPGRETEPATERTDKAALARPVLGFDPERIRAADPSVAEAFEIALDRLRRAGFKIGEIRLPDADPLALAMGALICTDALEQWRTAFASDPDSLGETARASLRYGASLTPAEIAKAEGLAARARAEIDAAFDAIDLIVGPTLAVPAPKAGARSVILGDAKLPVVRAMMRETCPFNLSGHPALAMPVAVDDNPIPFSLQIAGRRGTDLALLSEAEQIVRAASA